MFIKELCTLFRSSDDRWRLQKIHSPCIFECPEQRIFISSSIRVRSGRISILIVLPAHTTSLFIYFKIFENWKYMHVLYYNIYVFVYPQVHRLTQVKTQISKSNLLPNLNFSNKTFIFPTKTSLSNKTYNLHYRTNRPAKPQLSNLNLHYPNKPSFSIQTFTVQPNLNYPTKPLLSNQTFFIQSNLHCPTKP